jgi:hypothetical protein
MQTFPASHYLFPSTGSLYIKICKAQIQISCQTSKPGMPC